MYDFFFIVIHVLKELFCIWITLCYVGVFWVLFISMLCDRSFEQLSVFGVFSIICDRSFEKLSILGYSLCYVEYTSDSLTFYFYVLGLILCRWSEVMFYNSIQLKVWTDMFYNSMEDYGLESGCCVTHQVFLLIII